MRYAFGLVSLLVVAGVMIWVFSMTEIPKARKGQEIKQEVQPWTGRTADGQTAQNSIKVDGQMNGGSLSSLLVTDVTPGGYFEQYFGLKKGDKIIQIADVDVASFGDEGMAEAKVWEAGTGTLTVLRNGQKITLAAANGTSGASRAAPGGTGASGTPGAAPAQTPGGPTIPSLPGSIPVPQQ